MTRELFVGLRKWDNLRNTFIQFKFNSIFGGGGSKTGTNLSTSTHHEKVKDPYPNWPKIDYSCVVKSCKHQLLGVWGLLKLLV